MDIYPEPVRRLVDRDGLVSTADLREALSPREVRRLVEQGSLLRVIQGVYALGPDTVDKWLKLRALGRRTPGRFIGCFTTAADLLGIGIIADDQLHVVARSGHAEQAGRRLHRMDLTPDDVRLIDGVLVTSPARTMADLARLAGRLDAIAVLDLAARKWPEVISVTTDIPDRIPGARGLRQARELIGIVDPLAESPTESRARLRFVDAGLPVPESQLVVWDRYGQMRLDLGWREAKVAAEYDGSCHDGADSRRSDRRRHNRLRALGWDVYVFTDVDVYQRHERMCGLIRAALATTSRRAS